jgi:putative ABC transport system permease protein
MSWFTSDVRFGLRMLRKRPGHALFSVVALGLGIGLTTAAFSIVDGIALRGLPFPGADRLMLLGYDNPARGLHHLPVDPHDFADWARRQRSFEGLAAYEMGTDTLTVGGVAERLTGSAVSAGLLRLLRAEPVLGRGFQPRDEVPGAAPVALLGWRIWQDRFGGDPGIVGRAVRIDGHPATVVGVMPATFRFPYDDEIWSPLVLDLAGAARGKGEAVEVIGRLRPGVGLEQARAEMAAIARALAVELPRTNAGLEAVVQPFVEYELSARFRQVLFTMLGTVVAVLLIACINVAGLGLARAAQRTREIAVRTALGARSARLVTQILTESLLLALCGAALGVALARLGIGVFNAVLIERTPPYWMKVVVDPAALLCALGATLAAALLAGLAPALQAARIEPIDALKDEGRGSTSLRLGRFSRMVVVIELALSCALLVGAGLMVKSVVKAQNLALGFEPRGVLTFRVAVFPENVPRPADRAAFYGKLLDRLAARPGVQAVAGAETLPSNDNGVVPYAVEGRPSVGDNQHPMAHAVAISPGLFATLRAPVLSGRDFGRLDTAATQPVAIVNRSLARQAWPGQDPIGKRLRLVRGAGAEAWRTVVGMVPDLKMDGLDDRRPAGLYLPLAQQGPERLSFALRSTGPPLALVPMVRAEVAALDRDTPIYLVKTMDRMVAGNHFFLNLLGGMFSIVGAAALLLAAVGIYGVVALAVQRRTQEIGVRMALGAGSRDVLAMLLRQSVVQLGVGLACGLPAAWGISRLVGGMLFQVDPGDPAVFSLVALTLAVVALAATLVPGMRALRVDPLVAIRYD